MSTLPSTPDLQVRRRGSFKRLLTTLAAAIVVLTLVGTLAIIALASHTPQPNTGTGSPQHPAATQSNQSANSYVYSQPGLPVWGIQWSSDGKRLVSSNENVYSWDAFSGKHVITYTNNPISNGVVHRSSDSLDVLTRLSPDNKTLAVWNIGQIDLYDVATGKHLKTLTYPFSQSPAVKFNAPSFSPYISWSSDGKSLRALAGFPTSDFSRTNKLVTFNVATGARQELSLSLKGLLDQAAWSPNGKYVAVGWTSEGIVAVIDIASGQILHKQHSGAPIETIPLNWSPDSSKLIADFGNNSGLYVWNVATNEVTGIYHGGTTPSWSPNGKYIAVSNGSTIEILDASNGKLLHTYTSTGEAGPAAWASDSNSIAVGSRSADGKSGVVDVWKVAF